MQILWQLRRKITSQLATAPIETRAGLRAALGGVDGLLRAVFEIREGGRNLERN
jgi:hypothetical protein